MKLIEISRFLNHRILGGKKGESICARAYHENWKRAEKFFNWFFEPSHCEALYHLEARHGKAK